METDLNAHAETIKGYLITYLTARGVGININRRRGIFYECAANSGLTGFFGVDSGSEMRFAVINNGIINWALKEGFDTTSKEYENLEILINLKDEISLARFLAGQRNYKRRAVK